MNLRRLKEFLTTFFVITIALFWPIIIFIIFTLLSWFWSLPISLSLFLLYAYWIYIDRHTASQEGRWSDRLGQLSIWAYFTNYFPLKLIKTEDLDPKRNYIFGFHPHGLISMGAAGNFCTDATNFSTLFPNIRSHIMILRFQVFVPFTREIFLNLGVRPVSRDSCEYLLSGKCGHGHALVIVIGGIREQTLAQDHRMILYLKKRQGFVKLALEYEASLVPIISFGENELYRRYKTIPWGQSIFGYVPLRRIVTTVVDKPIHVDKKLNAISEKIDQLHRKYIQSVEELLEFNKNKYGLGHVKLEII